MTRTHLFPRVAAAAPRATALVCTIMTVAALSAVPVSAQKGGGSSSEPSEQNAVYGACSISWGVHGNQNCQLYVVPLGKRLVIQHASIACSSPTGYTVSQAFVGGMLTGTPWTPNATYIPVVDQPMPAGSSDVRQTGSVQLTAYADPGSPVRGQAWGYIGAYCAVNFSGYLVTMP